MEHNKDFNIAPTVDPVFLRLVQELSDAPGASGFEDAVVDVARRFAAPFADLQEDFLRNLYLHRRENTGDRPVVLLDAHSDEVGFIVHSIKPSGCLRFTGVGRFTPGALSSQKVLVRNALGDYLPGVIAAKPPHFQTAAERANPSQAISDYVIDIGASSREEAVTDFHIRIGEPVVPATRFAYDAAHDLLFGKAFDCRVGCAALLEVLRRLQGKTLPCDVVGVLSSQEEVGDRGARAAAARVQPQAAIVLEGCPADDTFTEPYAIQTALKRGPMFRHMDVSVICAPRFQRWTLELAAQKGLPVQESVREGGGNNASVYQSTGAGAPSVVAGIPVRYIHASHGIASYYDLEATVQVVTAMLEQLTPETIAGF